MCRTLKVSNTCPCCCCGCGCCCCCCCCWSGTADKLRRLLTNAAFQSDQRKKSCSPKVMATNKNFSSVFNSRKYEHWHFEKHRNTPGEEPAVLDGALDCTAPLLLEVKKLWAFVLTDTILPGPVKSRHVEPTQFTTCNCTFVRQPQVQRGEVRREERLGLPL